MFVISCKYNSKYPFVRDLVSGIRQFHPTEKILVVDSASDDKTYLSQLVDEFNVLVDDSNNKNWMVGAYWRAYSLYPNEDYYFFMHDSMKVKGNLDYLKENDINILFTFWRNASASFDHWNYRIASETTYPHALIKSGGRGVHGPIFFCKNKVITSIYNKGGHKILPSNKPETGYMEGMFGLFLEMEGYDLDKYSLFGDILVECSSGGKCGLLPHNTDWEHPVEKFYGNYLDECRRI